MAAPAVSSSPVGPVSQALKGLDIRDLQVEAVDGRVILRGLAACYKTKHAAGARAADAAPGMCIVNELRVAQAPSDDRQVERDVAASIERAVPGAAVRVRVRDGIVEIEGTARSADERCDIERATWETNGVVRVECRLALPGRAEHDDAVSEALAQYIRRAANLPEGAVAVRYRAGIVTLTGTAASDVQAQAIEDLVRWHERVTDVVNRLRIAAPAGARR